MSLSCLTKTSPTHKQEHHTTQAHKYGITNRMALSVIYGHLVALSMRCVAFISHFRLEISIDYIRK
jgi:hypothetical protein